jgi:hypothetical protein
LSNFLLRKEQDDAQYRVYFGTIQAPEEKALLMALAIFIDFKYSLLTNADDPRDWAWLQGDLVR